MWFTLVLKRELRIHYWQEYYLKIFSQSLYISANILELTPTYKLRVYSEVNFQTLLILLFQAPLTSHLTTLRAHNPACLISLPCYYSFSRLPTYLYVPFPFWLILNWELINFQKRISWLKEKKNPKTRSLILQTYLYLNDFYLPNLKVYISFNKGGCLC